MKLNKILTACGFALSCSLGFAGTTNGILLVQAEVAGACTLDVVNINFGIVSVAAGKSGEATSTGKIITNCTKDTIYTIKLGSGNSGNFTGDRVMTSANAANTDKLHYNIYKQNTSSILGDGSSGTVTVEKTASGEAQEEIIQAKIPYSQAVSADRYSDSLAVIIEY